MQRTWPSWVGKIAACILAVGLLAACVPPPQLTVTTVQSGVDIPWDIGWLPNRQMLFTERANGLSTIVNGQRQVVWKPTDLISAIEAGMMSIAVDYEYSTTHQVFVCFASNITGTPEVRIAKLTLNAAATAVTARTDILKGVPMNPDAELGKHSGCRIRFGPDHALWVGTGDAAIGTAPQDPHSLAGKVLRLDRSGWFPPTGNMSAPFDPRIQSYGHRNVQGIAFRQNGQVFAIEHGTGCDDEVNLLKTGANYGWDPVPRAPGDASYNEYTPMTDLARYPNAVPAVWSSGCPTIAPSGGVFVYGSQWGQWDGGLVLAVLKDHHLRMLRLSDDGLRVTTQSMGLSDHGRLRTDVIGPDGAMYVTTSNGGSTDDILRLTPAQAQG